LKKQRAAKYLKNKNKKETSWMAFEQDCRPTNKKNVWSSETTEIIGVFWPQCVGHAILYLWINIWVLLFQKNYVRCHKSTRRISLFFHVTQTNQNQLSIY
jgi:hypothetical protein